MKTVKASGDGYELISSPDGAFTPLLTVERWSPEVETIARRHGVERIAISPEWQGSTDLRELAGLAGQLCKLTIDSRTDLDLSVLAELPTLDELSLKCQTRTVPFGRLRALTRCLLAAPAKRGTVGEAPVLEHLALFGLQIPELGELSASGTLRSLSLNEVKGVPTLQGIEGLALAEVKLTSVSGLRSIARLAALELRSLELSGARKLDDWTEIGRLTSLRTLKIDSGPVIASFEPFGWLAELRELGIWNTPLAPTGVSVAPFAMLSHLRSLKLVGGSKSLRGLRDLDQLGRLTRLEVLFIDKGPQRIASIAWARTLTQLREFALHGTLVDDGDLGFLLDLPGLRLASVLPHQRHYSHSAATLAAISGRA